MRLVILTGELTFLVSDERNILRYMELSTCLVEIAEKHFHEEFSARPYAFILRKGNPELRDALSMA